MMKIRIILAVSVCLAISACASGPIYRPAQDPGSYGYRDTLLTSEQYRVSFSGDYNTARETVENLALFRAADLAISRGAEYFRVTSRETSPIVNQGNYGPTANVGYGYPYWGAGINTGIGYSGGRGYTEVRYETVLQVQVQVTADLPQDAPNVYDAQEVKKNLASLVAAAQK